MAYESLSFSGSILRRGFWIYIWEITAPDGVKYHYVGRTGDSSSINAASPFVRIGRHLDSKETATANSLHKWITNAAIDPKTCNFAFHAVGPLFPEQAKREDHVRYRDVLGQIEVELAARLHATIIGRHQKPSAFDTDLFNQTFAQVLAELSPNLPLLITDASRSLHS
jgi:hypothetical protein